MKKHSSLTGVGDLPHLATFAAVGERGSFTAAASDLGVTQAAVSQRIAMLEGELKVSLFDRRSGRASLTEAGRRLYAYARKILDLHGQARAEISGYRPAVAGDLPLAASSVPGEFFLPALLTAFHEKYPGIHVRAAVSDSGAVVRDVENGRAMLGLVGRDAEKTNLMCQPIGSDTLVLVVAPGHRWGKRKRVSLGELAREPLIIREPGSGSRFALEKGLQRGGAALADWNIMLELGSNAAISNAVRRRLGVAFLSRLTVRRELEADELREIAVSGLSLTRHFYVIHHRGRPLSPSASVFRNFLETHQLGDESP
jgi:LysR family transcriptional regulator, low CO2-responsive transcriptional regulator